MLPINLQVTHQRIYPQTHLSLDWPLGSVTSTIEKKTTVVNMLSTLWFYRQQTSFIDVAGSESIRRKRLSNMHKYHSPLANLCRLQASRFLEDDEADFRYS